MVSGWGRCRYFIIARRLSISALARSSGCGNRSSRDSEIGPLSRIRDKVVELTSVTRPSKQLVTLRSKSGHIHTVLIRVLGERKREASRLADASFRLLDNAQQAAALQDRRLSDLRDIENRGQDVDVAHLAIDSRAGVPAVRQLHDERHTHQFVWTADSGSPGTRAP